MCSEFNTAVEMKNFPHQFADIERLTEALRTAQATISSGKDFGRDDVFGPELARSGVYTFRAGDDLEANLKAEVLKPRASRGTETAAREMRRFLVLSGFLEFDEASDTFSVTPRGVELLSANIPAVVKALWRDAMLALSLEDAEGNKSHPYRILLRLVADNPGIETFKLMLAFECRDDSEDEYERIVSLIGHDFEHMISLLGVGESKARNAVKILPSIADQVGDIHRESGKSYPLATLEIAEDGIDTAKNSAKKKSAPSSGKKVTKKVSAGSIASNPDFSNGDGASSTFDLSGAIELRKRRTKQHQSVVRGLASALEANAYDLFEDPFDCLAKKAGKVILFEIKTLDGSPSDERRQGEKALGQVMGYRHFDLPAEVGEKSVYLSIVFSQKPSEAMLRFLSKNGVIPVWLGSGEEFIAIDGTGNMLGLIEYLNDL